MHRHDQDLIMALAEGTISGTAADEARHEIESCQQCRLDLEMQVGARSWLAEARPVEMTEIETARLRRNLDVELAHERSPAAVTPSKSSQRWAKLQWGPIVSVAAVLIAVVLVAPQLDLLGGSDDSADVAATIALTDRADAPESASVTEDSVRSSDGGARDQGATAQEMEDLTAAAEAPAEDDSFFAGTTTVAATAGDAADGALAFTSLTEILGQLQAADGNTEVASDALQNLTYLSFRAAVPPINCLAESAEAVEESLERSVLGFVELEDGTDAIVIVHYGSGEVVTAVVAHDPATCAAIGSVTPEGP